MKCDHILGDSNLPLCNVIFIWKSIAHNWVSVDGFVKILTMFGCLRSKSITSVLVFINQPEVNKIVICNIRQKNIKKTLAEFRVIMILLGVIKREKGAFCSSEIGNTHWETVKGIRNDIFLARIIDNLDSQLLLFHCNLLCLLIIYLVEHGKQ